jgi:hypothetical protein
METTTFDTQALQPIADELMREAMTVVDHANTMTIATQEDYADAADFLKSIKAEMARRGDKLDPARDAAYKAYQVILALIKEALKPLLAAEATTKKKMAAYSDEQERIRREEQARAEAEAKRLAEESAMREAEALVDAGQTEEAERVIEEAVAYVPPPVVLQTAPKVAGIATRKVWKHRTTNPSAIKRAYLIPNEKAIAAIVRQLGPVAVEQVGGIEVYQETSIAAGRG